MTPEEKYMMDHAESLEEFVQINIFMGPRRQKTCLRSSPSREDTLYVFTDWLMFLLGSIEVLITQCGYAG